MSQPCNAGLTCVSGVCQAGVQTAGSACSFTGAGVQSLRGAGLQRAKRNVRHGRAQCTRSSLWGRGRAAGVVRGGQLRPRNMCWEPSRGRRVRSCLGSRVRHRRSVHRLFGQRDQRDVPAQWLDGVSVGRTWPRVLLGERPRALLWLLAPTALAVVLDLVLRARSLAGHAARGQAIYLSSILVSAGFWVLPLRLGSQLLAARRPWARVTFALVLGTVLLPLSVFCYAGQALYYRLFHAYMARDTVRLGIALRGTVVGWFASWGGPWLAGGMFAVGCAIAWAMVGIMRKATPAAAGPVPVLPVVTFAGALVCFWTDNVDSRFLQAATPDACLVHGLVHALRVSVTGKGGIHQGMSVRTPAPVPQLARAGAAAPNVMVILTESVRADALCSEPPSVCPSPFLDDLVPGRIPLGKLTSQTPNTFSAFLVLTTGLAPNVPFREAHTAPVLWEVAGAVSYRTAYITSQNPKYEDFGAFTRRAGIDVLTTGSDLGGLGDEQLGAPDERAVDAMLDFVRSVPAGTPYFGLLHLSNTHAPYRVDPSLQPFAPHSDNALGDLEAFHNHYRNSVRLEERTLSVFLRGLKALPSWDRTVVVLLSDHGEQFGDHGRLYHNHSLFDDDLRVPGWLCGGPRSDK